MLLPGTPSDEVGDVLATGRGDITTLFISMATRHPDGTDADYLRWHTLDHRPEQHRLSGVRASLRLVSTPACRSARAASKDRYDAIDHVMTYFFSDPGGLDGFYALSKALGGAGRKLRCCPRSSAVCTTCSAGRRRRGSRSAPTCFRGGPSAGCICCWSEVTRPQAIWPRSTVLRACGRPRW